MTGKARMARYRRFIPAIFSVIIISFVGKLWYDNVNLTERNSRLREQFLLANDRNMKFADQMEPITKRLDSLAKLLDEETRRRSVAEQNASALQKENEFLRNSKQCSISIDPNAVQKGSKDPSSVIIQAAPAGE
ncbi:hypothetical protein [Pantoea sp. ME81]|uniref:hypothetical protein n=1 Tax=Pantoea sp. ME81 TaxID=2743935 RepID=UPI0015F57CA3|nr:hypothetical protein [Pantoea sp. ME81]